MARGKIPPSRTTQSLNLRQELRGFADRLSKEIIGSEARVTRRIDRVDSGMHESFSELQGSVDTYLKRSEGWHQEFAVLKARHDKLATLLMKKGMVSEEELAL